MKKRVVITGMSGVTSLGQTAEEIFTQAIHGKTGIRVMEEWQDLKGLTTQLGAPIREFTLPEHYSRKQTRSMGRVAQLATVATEAALRDANLLENSTLLTNGRLGLAYGSCSGSTLALADLLSIRDERVVKNITATTYIKAMSHTCAVNLALFFGVTGRIIPTTSACTSSSQAMGYAYETLQNNKQDIMIVGGAEELCASQAAIFDSLYATSHRNDEPTLTPRPFDKLRDGLVLGEGAGTLIFETYDHAISRGATIYGEVVGFGTNCDAVHVTQPSAERMLTAMTLALEDAGLRPSDIGYINAHGTATEAGDNAESKATEAVFGNHTPISSLKGHFGHTLGACGAIEAWLCLEMMKRECFLPTANLVQVDDNCGNLAYIQDKPLALHCDYVMSNNFAFGGINTSLIFKRW